MGSYAGMTRRHNTLYHDATGGSSLRTRERHQLSVDTVEKLVTAKNGQTWRACATALGYEPAYAATLNKAARGVPGAMTLIAENILRARLGLSMLRAVTVTACPDCGSVHTGRCHGRPVVQVVTLTAEERVTRKPTKIIRRWADLSAAELAQALANRQPYTGDKHVHPEAH